MRKQTTPSTWWANWERNAAGEFRKTTVARLGRCGEPDPTRTNPLLNSEAGATLIGSERYTSRRIGFVDTYAHLGCISHFIAG